MCSRTASGGCWSRRAPIGWVARVAASGNVIADESQRSFLRGLVIGWAARDDVMLDDDSVTTLVDRYVEQHGR